MPNSVVTIIGNIKATRSLEAKRSVGLEERTGSDVRSSEGVRDGVRDIVLRRRVALGGVEENVFPIHDRQTGRFDIRAVLRLVGEDLERRADLLEPVACVHLLEEDGRGYYGLDGVAALAAVADRVAVDLVNDVTLACSLVVEASWVDGSALFDRADPSIARRINVRTLDVFASGPTNAVNGSVRGQRCRVIHDERSIGKSHDIWRPNLGLVLVNPRRQLRHGVFFSTELPGLPISRVSHRHVNPLAINLHFGSKRSPAIPCSDDRRIRKVSTTQTGCDRADT